MKCGNVKEWGRRMQTRHVDFFRGIGGLKPSLVHVGAPSRYAPDHQVFSGQEVGLAVKAMLTSFCTGHLDVVFTTKLPMKDGSRRRFHYGASHEGGISSSPYKIVDAAPHQARGSKTCRWVTKTPSGRHRLYRWFTAEPSTRYLHLAFLSISWSNLALTLLKFVLKPMVARMSSWMCTSFLWTSATWNRREKEKRYK
jgi:hypothetical protein